MTITKELAEKVLATVDAGLCSGLGKPKPGQMCVEAAVCYAMGLPHGDKPTCVAEVVRIYKIKLNDAAWSSNEARARGMRRVAIAQLGSTSIDEVKFSQIVALEVTKQILPKALRAVSLEAAAVACEEAKDLKEAEAAAYAAKAAATAAANAAYAAYAAYAATAAAYAATAAARAANTAAYAANAAAAAAANAAAADAAAAARDEILTLAAEIAVQALIECKSDGVKFLYLCDN